jgi:predicted TIM-barrel fold metal-dependent hydrolase
MTMSLEVNKIWANSGDSHILEPADIWTEAMPAELADRMPRVERRDDATEILHVEGRSFVRRLPAIVRGDGESQGLSMAELQSRPPGAHDLQLRLKDLDNEGIWGEVIYPSIGLWNGLIRDPVLYREGVRVLNDWLKAQVLDVSPRFVVAAQLPVLDVDDAVAEMQRARGMGFQAVGLPTSLDGRDNWNSHYWEPLWAAAEEARMVLAFHVGSDAKDPESDNHRPFRGPGGAVLNYNESTYSGQRAAAMMVASGALDRHPDLRVLISEGGATWVAFLADRMDEGYRQHGLFVKPKLSRMPSEIIYGQIYASFQHDKSAVGTYRYLGYKHVMWGSDYPHIEGTFGHTQETLQDLFVGVDDDTVYQITQGNFLELFPSVGARSETSPTI